MGRRQLLIVIVRCRCEGPLTPRTPRRGQARRTITHGVAIGSLADPLAWRAVGGKLKGERRETWQPSIVVTRLAVAGVPM